MRSSSRMLGRSRFAYRPVQSALRAREEPAIPTGNEALTPAIERDQNLQPLNGFPVLEPARGTPGRDASAAEGTRSAPTLGASGFRNAAAAAGG